MKTDELIAMLSTNLEPVDRRRPWRHLAAAVAIGASAAFALMYAALGMRADLAPGGPLLFLALKLVFAGTVLAVAVSSLSKAMRPGGERNVSLAAVWLPFTAIILLALLSLALSPSSHWRAMLVGDEWLECLVSIPLIAIVPFALITWAVWQEAPTNLTRAGTFVGLAAGSISALGYALHCSEDTLPFVAVWYGGTIGLCTLAGLKLGPVLLRW